MLAEYLSRFVDLCVQHPKETLAIMASVVVVIVLFAFLSAPLRPLIDEVLG